MTEQEAIEAAKHLCELARENERLRSQVAMLANDLSYAYAVVRHGFEYGTFDLSVLKDRALAEKE